MQLRRRRDGDRERAERPSFPLQQGDAAEEEQQHEEIVPTFDGEREQLRVQRQECDEREAIVHAAREERHDREGRHVGRQVEIALVPEKPDRVEEPHERCCDEEQEREVREVIQRGIVHHRPVIERGVEVVRHVRVLPEQELARGPLDHERAVVDVRVRLSRLAQHDRREGRHHDEDGDDGGDVEGALTWREGGARAVIAHRVRDRQDTARDEEGDVGPEREELPDRDIARRCDGRVVREKQHPVR